MKDTERQVCEMQNPHILVTDKGTNVNDMIPILEQLVKTKEPCLWWPRTLLVKRFLPLVNKLRGVLDIVAIKALLSEIVATISTGHCHRQALHM